ncbi:hypothetical protein L596_012225 [Steinernema carpocapsae]|uniref:Uncharacterized protein n=1 Tax=Steinernema carpocapsae TaxID=34508 RepID=A0A4V6A4Q5_STECR|nr:hypothetical protein L596_012225 [Steinernema carpocapsae]
MAAATLRVFVLLPFLTVSLVRASALSNCPMVPVKSIIQKAVDAVGRDPSMQMQMIRRIMEDIYGGTWGVLIIRDPHLVSDEIHWTIPDHKHKDGSSAFCLHVAHNWQYNIFKTGNVDTLNRFTVEEVVSKIRSKKLADKFTRDLFSRRVADFARRRKSSRDF